MTVAVITVRHGSLDVVTELLDVVTEIAGVVTGLLDVVMALLDVVTGLLGVVVSGGAAATTGWTVATRLIKERNSTRNRMVGRSDRETNERQEGITKECIIRCGLERVHFSSAKRCEMVVLHISTSLRVSPKTNSCIFRSWSTTPATSNKGCYLHCLSNLDWVSKAWNRTTTLWRRLLSVEGGN